MTIQNAVAFDDLNELFELIELLDNTESLLKEFYPDVQHMMVRKDFFSGHFLMEYQRNFNDKIQSLIKRTVINHKPGWNPEKVLTLCDLELLLIIAPELFKTENYSASLRTMEGN